MLSSLHYFVIVISDVLRDVHIFNSAMVGHIGQIGQIGQIVQFPALR